MNVLYTFQMAFTWHINNLLGICHQLKASVIVLGLHNFVYPVYSDMGTGSWSCLRFSSFSWKQKRI